ncbi:hypothetical protein BJY52DRAFT_1206691 [Lactarius psammicola]|nr:hypothetical protein BJY52DRAFT_1206691 [Lactarius psammicola]
MLSVIEWRQNLSWLSFIRIRSRAEKGDILEFLYSSSEIIKRKDAITYVDVRDLVLHVIANSPPPSWIRNTESIQKYVVLLISGLTSTVLSLPPLPTSAKENPILPIPIPHTLDPPPPTPSEPPDFSSSVDPHSEEAAALYGGVPFIARMFSHACPTRVPGDTTRIYSTPVSGEEKKRRIQERISEKEPAQYFLTIEQMVEDDYPIPSYLADVIQKSEGWIETPQVAAGAEGFYTVYAIDRVMCTTNDGKALTRVCVTDFNSGKVLYDQLVKPPNPITDYLTCFSGITAAALDPVTTTLADVQTHLRTLIKPSTILLGHSLESDLHALQLAHSRRINTPGRIIQDRGPGYWEFRTDYEPILVRIARSRSRKSGSNGAPTRTAIVDHGNPGAWHGTSATVPATTVACANDAEVLGRLLGALDSHGFVFGRITPKADADGLSGAEKARDQNLTGTAETKTENAETQPLPSPPDGNSNTLFAAVTNLDAHLTALHAALPPRTALLLYLGHSDPRSMSTLAARRAEYQGSQNQQHGKQSSSREATGAGSGEVRWSTADDRALEEAVVRAWIGLLFVGVKM